MAVLLSGLMADGREGLWEVRKRGGLTKVQDPKAAKFPELPSNAIADIPVHYCLPLPQLAAKLVEGTARAPESKAADDAPIRVLIVEDERIVAMNLENRLCELGI